MRICAVIFLMLFSPSTIAMASIGDCETALIEMQKLAKDLRSFEKSQSFKYYGFAVGGPHHAWLRKAEKLRDQVGKKTRMPVSADGDFLLPGKLLLWGLDRMRCATRTKCDREYIHFMDEILETARCDR